MESSVCFKEEFPPVGGTLLIVDKMSSCTKVLCILGLSPIKLNTIH